MKIHAKKFDGNGCRETLGGPEVYEEYVPLCGIPWDVELTRNNDWKDEGTTCKRCLKILLTNEAPRCEYCNALTDHGFPGICTDCWAQMYN